MNNKIGKLFFCLFLLVIGSSVFAASKKEEVPTWVLNPMKEYPASEYLTYVGDGKDRKAAELAALEGISSVFGQDIQSSTQSSKRMMEADIGGTRTYAQSSGISQDILRNVNVDDLIGVEMKGFWFDNDSTWYAIAVIDKAKTVGIYKEMMSKNKAAIDNLLANAKKDLYSLESYCAYDFAQEIALQNKQSQAKIYVLDPDSAKAFEQYVVSPDNIGAEKMKIAKEIPIAVVIDGDDNGKYASVFLEALSEKGFNGSLGGNVRYLITGSLSLTEEPTSRTVKIYYDFDAFMLDTKTDTQLFPINIRGRQSHKTAEQAMIRVENDITKKIKSTFLEELDKYVNNYNVK